MKKTNLNFFCSAAILYIGAQTYWIWDKQVIV